MVDTAANNAGRLRLRAHLAVSPSDNMDYLVEDPMTNRYYRVGMREFTVLDELAEYTTAHAAFVRANERLGNEAFDETEFSSILEWLHNERLIENENAALAPSRAPERDPARWLNLMTFRIPLGNPDRLLERIVSRARFVTSGWFFALWLAVCASAILVVLFQWPRFSAAASGIFYVNNWLSLLALWVLIKVLHELFHGVVCKRYGGHVLEVGVILILFIPIGYVDATTSWRFANRWQRIFTALAGMYIELLCAGVAAWIWALTDPGVVNDLAYQAVILASVTTLLFNANPLMRFDGYFALTDLIRTPNLYAHGRRYVFYLLRRYGLGDRGGFDAHGLRYPGIVKCYGVAALIWRTMVIVMLLIAAKALFHGAGIIIAGCAFIAVVIIPWWRNVRMLAAGRDSRNRLAVAARLAGLAVIIGLISTNVSWQADVVTPAIVEYADRQIIRADAAGFVETVHVQTGDAVAADALLLSLTNPELQERRTTLALDIAQSAIRLRLHHKAGHAAHARSEQENLDQLRRLHAAAEEDVAALRIRAPIVGRINGAGLADLKGRYLDSGERIAELIGSPRKEVHISLSESAMNFVGVTAGAEIAVRFARLPTVRVDTVVDRIDPAVSRRIPYAALAAVNAGPVSVRVPQSANGTTEGPNYEFVEPRGAITASLDAAAGATLYAGELGYAKLPGRSMSLAAHVFVRIESWINRLARNSELVQSAAGRGSTEYGIWYTGNVLTRPERTDRKREQHKAGFRDVS